MSDYRAPVKDMRFVQDELAGFRELTQYPDFAEATPDMADAILEEAAKFTGEVLAPLNRVGDKEGCKLGPDGVTTPPGWKEAYKAFCDAGWNGIACPPDHAGHGQPDTLAVAVKEMVMSANLSFSLGPLAHHRRGRGAADLRQRRTEGDLPGKDGHRRVDRHHEPDRAAGRLRPGADPFARRAAGRRQLQGLRPEDLHHLRRPRHDGQHRPPRARPPAGCAGRGQGHLDVPGAQVPGQCRRLARRAQRRLVRLDRTQARHPRQPDLRHGLWRQWRGGRLPARRSRIAASNTCSS